MNKTRLHLAVTVAAMGLFAARAFASVAIPDTPAREWPPNPEMHKISITRTAATAQEYAAIRVAEAAYPARDAVLKVFQGEAPKNESKLWWYWEMSGTRLPYAITGDAVNYYTRLVKRYRTESDHGYWEPRSNFTYKASAKWHGDEVTIEGMQLSRVWEVDMQMDYTHSEASGFMMMFSKTRKVILDQNCRVLDIFGDGETPVAVT